MIFLSYELILSIKFSKYLYKEKLHIFSLPNCIIGSPVLTCPGITQSISCLLRLNLLQICTSTKTKLEKKKEQNLTSFVSKVWIGACNFIKKP